MITVLLKEGTQLRPPPNAKLLYNCPRALPQPFEERHWFLNLSEL